MTISVYLRKEHYELDEKQISAGEVLNRLGLSPQAYLVVRDLNLLTDKDIIHDGEEVRIIAVISGGSSL